MSWTKKLIPSQTQMKLCAWKMKIWKYKTLKSRDSWQEPQTMRKKGRKSSSISMWRKKKLMISRQCLMKSNLTLRKFFSSLLDLVLTGIILTRFRSMKILEFLSMTQISMNISPNWKNTLMLSFSTKANPLINPHPKSLQRLCCWTSSIQKNSRRKFM